MSSSVSSNSNASVPRVGILEPLVLNYLDAFRLSWLLDQEIDESWLSDHGQALADRSGAAVYPTVGLTKTLAALYSDGEFTELSGGDSVPRWYVLRRATMSRLAGLIGQFLALQCARKYLHAPAVHLVRSRAMSRDVIVLFESEGAKYAPPDSTRALVCAIKPLTDYVSLGSLILRGACHPYDVQCRAMRLRLELRLAHTDVEALSKWTKQDCDWASRLSGFVYQRFSGELK
jgi:hypothetical protein